ncbi:sensor histidine kinase [Conexibacter sp. SYSU D00693]|uniref:sensor histidine kinase n=1 Tax=Conexibacter sp. SYSU D00693 TaxID=2812560 RepID=UPI00196B6E23|nr:sensor histidine kinase [Conexibacter sp. SYSU D00693]
MREALRQASGEARRLALAALDGLVRLGLLLAAPVSRRARIRAQARADARRAEHGWTSPAPRSWRDVAWLAVPVGVPLFVLFVDLFAAAVFGVVMPAVWALDGDGRVPYQWVMVTDLAMAFFAVPVGGLMLVLCAFAPRLFLRADDAWTRFLLAPTKAARMAARVQRLTDTRQQAVDSSAGELRRIERDLHDGAQARLVSLTLHLGMAEDLLEREPEAARTMLAQARADADTAMADLRALVHGIAPPLLTERGLRAALEDVAARSPVPVSCTVDVDRRLPAPLESAAYFTTVELLTNAIRHSGARHIALRAADRDGGLAIDLTDDGRGGADPEAGTGLRGVQRRLAPFDGTLTITSPPGGPTTVQARLPCASS